MQMKRMRIERGMARVEEVEFYAYVKDERVILWFSLCLMFIFCEQTQAKSSSKQGRETQTNTHRHTRECRSTVHCLYKHTIDPEANSKLPTQLLNESAKEPDAAAGKAFSLS